MWKRVYLIWEENTSYYKIGVSYNPFERLKGIQTGNASKVHLVSAVSVSDAHFKEKEFHRKYKNYHVKGEWFSFPPRVIAEVLRFFNIYTVDKLETSETFLLEQVANLRLQLEFEKANTAFQMERATEYSVSLDYWFRKANGLKPDDQYVVGANSEGGYITKVIY